MTEKPYKVVTPAEPELKLSVQEECNNLIEFIINSDMPHSKRLTMSYNSMQKFEYRFASELAEESLPIRNHMFFLFDDLLEKRLEHEHQEAMKNMSEEM